MAAFPSLGELTLSEEVSPAAWVLGRVRNFDGTVGCLLPSGFDGYARLFHPAYRNTATVQDEEVTWRAVAQANGRTAHPGMEWVAITGSWRYTHSEVQPGLWDHPPNTGSLPTRQTAQLDELLAAHTSTPAACWFAVWDGFGHLPPGPGSGTKSGDAAATHGAAQRPPARGDDISSPSAVGPAGVTVVA